MQSISLSEKFMKVQAYYYIDIVETTDITERT